MLYRSFAWEEVKKWSMAASAGVISLARLAMVGERSNLMCCRPMEHGGGVREFEGCEGRRAEEKIMKRIVILAV